MKKLIGAALSLALLVGIAGTAAQASVTGVPELVPAYPAFDWVPAGGFPDAFPYGQCTYWAAYNARVSWNGNAADWLTNAQALGVRTAGTPSVGAIVVYLPGNGYSELGHVAVVTGVEAGAYVISEMNFLGLGLVDRRAIGWPDPHVAGFIPRAQAGQR